MIAACMAGIQRKAIRVGTSKSARVLCMHERVCPRARAQEKAREPLRMSSLSSLASTDFCASRKNIKSRTCDVHAHGRARTHIHATRYSHMRPRKQKCERAGENSRACTQMQTIPTDSKMDLILKVEYFLILLGCFS
jgi:hypothetical protein